MKDRIKDMLMSIQSNNEFLKDKIKDMEDRYYKTLVNSHIDNASMYLTEALSELVQPDFDEVSQSKVDIEELKRSLIDCLCEVIGSVIKKKTYHNNALSLSIEKSGVDSIVSNYEFGIYKCLSEVSIELLQLKEDLKETINTYLE